MKTTAWASVLAALSVGVTLAIQKIDFSKLLTTDMIRFTFEVTLCALAATFVCWGLSWTWTQLYKRSPWGPDLDALGPAYVSPMTPTQRAAELRAGEERQRRAKGVIYLHAVISGLLAELAAGWAAWQLLGLEHRWLGVFALAWGLWGAIVAGASPFIWWLVFVVLLRLLGWRKKIDPATGAEGLKHGTDETIYDRPPPAAGGKP